MIPNYIEKVEIDTSKVDAYKVKSNGDFCLLSLPYDYSCGEKVRVLCQTTGKIFEVKLYDSLTKGQYFKKWGNQYLNEFTKVYKYVPMQLIYEEK